MRVGSHSRAQTLEHERMADQVLDRLHGYTRRQGSTMADRQFLVAAIFDEWEQQVQSLQWRVGALEADLAEANRRVRYLEWRLTQAPWRRAWAYLKFLVGANPWPSSP